MLSEEAFKSNGYLSSEMTNTIPTKKHREQQPRKKTVVGLCVSVIPITDRVGRLPTRHKLEIFLKLTHQMGMASSCLIALHFNSNDR